MLTFQLPRAVSANNDFEVSLVLFNGWVHDEFAEFDSVHRFAAADDGAVGFAYVAHACRVHAGDADDSGIWSDEFS